MQVYIRLVWLLFAFACVLIHARNINLDTNDQHKPVYFHKTSATFAKKFFNMFPNEQYIPYEHEHLSPIARQAKAIIKGDPREFMG